MSADHGAGPKPQPPTEFRDVHDFLAQVRLRPGAWLPGGSLQHLQAMLIGYGVALDTHGVDEPFEFAPAVGAFPEWLNRAKGLSLVPGWARAVEDAAGDEPPLDVFFRYLDEWRADTAAGPRA
ncbi:hypothetical protein ACFV0O_39370 [Kitasatospora sp. NPDC059577]|uniref:hypothetical protein n=1 Tax=Kitasatospora sp. NPDC059577 TaxID=3346873 RepID=UPI0036C6916D